MSSQPKSEFLQVMQERGFYHDCTDLEALDAALMGGVGGHAGLFGTANDVAIIMQMNLQKGIYGGRQYLKSQTLNKFNKQPYRTTNRNRRGIGWDKPLLRSHRGSTSKYAPHTSYGHTGYTGTACWADPESNTVFVFLSNRVHPSSYNKKLITEDYREKLMDLFYEALGKNQLRKLY